MTKHLQVIFVGADTSFSGVFESLLFVVEKFNVHLRRHSLTVSEKVSAKSLWGKESAEHSLLRPTGAGYSSLLLHSVV